MVFWEAVPRGRMFSSIPASVTSKNIPPTQPGVPCRARWPRVEHHHPPPQERRGRVGSEGYGCALCKVRNSQLVGEKAEKQPKQRYGVPGWYGGVGGGARRAVGSQERL